MPGPLIHVVGEMVGSPAASGASQMGLAPRERQGQYQGFAGMSFSLAGIVAPPLVTFLCIDWGRPGWFVLGGLILAAGALAPRLRVGPAHPGAVRRADPLGLSRARS